MKVLSKEFLGEQQYYKLRQEDLPVVTIKERKDLYEKVEAVLDDMYPSQYETTMFGSVASQYGPQVIPYLEVDGEINFNDEEGDGEDILDKVEAIIDDEVEFDEIKVGLVINMTESYGDHATVEEIPVDEKTNNGPYYDILDGLKVEVEASEGETTDNLYDVIHDMVGYDMAAFATIELQGERQILEDIEDQELAPGVYVVNVKCGEDNIDDFTCDADRLIRA